FCAGGRARQANWLACFGKEAPSASCHSHEKSSSAGKNNVNDKKENRAWGTGHSSSRRFACHCSRPPLLARKPPRAGSTKEATSGSTTPKTLAAIASWISLTQATKAAACVCPFFL